MQIIHLYFSFNSDVLANLRFISQISLSYQKHLFCNNKFYTLHSPHTLSNQLTVPFPFTNLNVSQSFLDNKILGIPHTYLGHFHC